jgi:DNA-binding transcriptional ArsR family regulator
LSKVLIGCDVPSSPLTQASTLEALQVAGSSPVKAIKHACQLHAMERVLWWLIAGTKGGVNRARMINTLRDRPYNANQLSEVLELDYKTIRYHLKILSENSVVTSTGNGYGAMYFLSPAMEANYALFEEIWDKIGNKFK